MKKSLLIAAFLGCLGIGKSLAQAYRLESNYWYFGSGAGLRFDSVSSTGNPIPLDNANQAFDCPEGSGAISDSTGRLLFYTNGETVWNRDHQQMGTGLFGGTSSTQNAIIMHKPGSGRYYYIFTVDEVESLPNQRGWRYSVVDMEANSGLGGIDTTQKNVLIDPDGLEKISAVLHANGRWVWVITHGYENNLWKAALFTENGLDTVITSSIGYNYTSPNTSAGESVMRGCLKFSPNGKYVASASTEVFNLGSGRKYYVQVCRFNDTTGHITSHTALEVPTPNSTDIISGPYGVEFSADESKLYASKRAQRSRTQIYQWNLNAGDSAAINQSRFTVADLATTSPSPSTFGTLQIGMDKRIYASTGRNFLSRINSPDSAGTASDFSLNAVPLAQGTTVDRGLTNLNVSFVNAPVLGLSKKAPKPSALSIRLQSAHAQARLPQGYGGGYGSLYSSTGALVWSSGRIAAGSAELTVPCTGLAPGAYTLVVSSPKGTSQGRFVWQ